MRAIRLRAVMVILSILGSGCMLSVDEVIPRSAAVIDQRLVGRWESASGTEHATITSAADGQYTVEYIDARGRRGFFNSYIGRLDTFVVADVVARDGPADSSAPDARLLLSGHLMLVLRIGVDRLSVGIIQPDSLVAAIRAGSIDLHYIHDGDQILLTDPSERLRAELGSYLSRSGVPDGSQLWRRSSRGTREDGVESHTSEPCFEASAWRDADLLFRRDPHWVGADGAYSVDLGKGRTLWLFGDTWIDSTGRHTRRGARMIRNSIAIQTGADPSTAAITFHWGEERPNGDRAFFPNRGSEWFWPGDGIRLGDRLILFLMRIHETRGGTGFESSGWNAVMVSNPDADPSRWDMKWIDQQENATGVVIGSASVIRWGEYLYAYGAQETVKSHPIHLVRWPVERAGKGDLRSPQWWAGADIGWAGDSSSIPRWPAFENGATELTVHYDTLSRNFLAFHTVGFGAADIAIRSSPLPGGPWSGPRMIYRPSEYYRPDIMIYSAKAHPQLRGADLVLTYSTNSFRFSEQLSDSLIYYPRFVRLARCR